MFIYLQKDIFNDMAVFLRREMSHEMFGPRNDMVYVLLTFPFFYSICVIERVDLPPSYFSQTNYY